MFAIDSTDIKRFAVSAVGAVALTAASVFAAAAPAKAATVTSPATVAEWQGRVERQLDSETDMTAASLANGRIARAALVLDFTADGDFAGARIARSSGNASVDAQALRIASRIVYPALPAGYRGSPRTIEMRLAFGGDTMPLRRAPVRVAAVGRGVQLAAR